MTVEAELAHVGDTIATAQGPAVVAARREHEPHQHVSSVRPDFAAVELVTSEGSVWFGYRVTPDPSLSLRLR